MGGAGGGAVNTGSRFVTGHATLAVGAEGLGRTAGPWVRLGLEAGAFPAAVEQAAARMQPITIIATTADFRTGPSS